MTKKDNQFKTSEDEENYFSHQNIDNLKEEYLTGEEFIKAIHECISKFPDKKK